MKQIAYPAGVREIAAKNGCELPSHARFGVDRGLRRFGAEIAARAVAPLKGFANTTAPAPTRAPIAAPTAPATTAKGIGLTIDPATIANKSVPSRAPITTLAFPADVHPAAALAVADKALSDPKAKAVVERTITAANLPDAYQFNIDPETLAAIQRAAATLDAAAKIRETGSIPASQPIVPIQTADQAAAVSSAANGYPLSDADLAALASATQQMIADSRHHGPIERFLDWLKKWLT